MAKTMGAHDNEGLTSRLDTSLVWGDGGGQPARSDDPGSEFRGQTKGRKGRPLRGRP